MLFAAYAEVGGGILPLFVCGPVAVGLLAWGAYWAARGFRARRPFTPPGRRLLWAAIGLAGGLMLSLPLLRAEGEWRAERDGQPLPPSVRAQLDRDYFGYIPRYSGVGDVGARERMDPGVISGHNGSAARCQGFRWAIDWWLLATQAACLSLLALPFVRAKLTRKPA